MGVLELLRWRAPNPLILLLLLIQWNQQIPHTIDRQFVEVFSGVGEVSRAFRDVGRRGTSIDLCLDEVAFDLTRPSAFGLVLNEILRCKPGSTVLMAPDCRSLSRMSRHTSGRTYLSPLGNQGYLFVKIGNILSARTALLAFLCSFCGLRWVIEQPEGTFLPQLPRYQWLFGVLKVFATTMYMGVFGSGSPKKHRLLSNDPAFLEKIHDKAGFMSRVDQAKCDTKLVHRYIDKNGKRRCTGLKKELKESANYPPAFGDFIASIAVEMEAVPVPMNVHLDESFPTDLTDLELFRRFCLPIGDPWKDACLWDAVEYFARAKYMQVPNGWDQLLYELKLRPLP